MHLSPIGQLRTFMLTQTHLKVKRLLMLWFTSCVEPFVAFVSWTLNFSDCKGATSQIDVFNRSVSKLYKKQIREVWQSTGRWLKKNTQSLSVVVNSCVALTSYTTQWKRSVSKSELDNYSAWRATLGYRVWWTGWFRRPIPQMKIRG